MAMTKARYDKIIDHVREHLVVQPNEHKRAVAFMYFGRYSLVSTLFVRAPDNLDQVVWDGSNLTLLDHRSWGTQDLSEVTDIVVYVVSTNSPSIKKRSSSKYSAIFLESGEIIELGTAFDSDDCAKLMRHSIFKVKEVDYGPD